LAVNIEKIDEIKKGYSPQLLCWTGLPIEKLFP